jgi:hypothetical protein
MKAVELAKSTGARLHVVAVGRTFSQAVFELYTETEEGREALRREAQEVLDEQVRKIEEAGGTGAVSHLKFGERRDEAIVHLAEDIGADLIVIGSRGHGGLRRALMGAWLTPSSVMPTARSWSCGHKTVPIVAPPGAGSPLPVPPAACKPHGYCVHQAQRL